MSLLDNMYLVAVKRLGENHTVELTLESKRPRSQQLPSETSSNIANVTASLSTQAPVSTAVSTPPSFNPSLQLPQGPVKPPTMRQHTAQQQHITERFRMADMQLQQLDTAIKNANSGGNIQLAESLKRERDKQLTVYLKFKAAVATYAHNQARAGLPMQQGAGNSSSASVVHDGVGSTNLQTPQSAAHQPQLPSTHKDQQPHAYFGSDNAVHGHDPQAASQPNRPPSSSLPPLPNTTQSSAPGTSPSLPPFTGFPPQIVAQMQQFIEQQRNRPTPMPGPQPISQSQGTEQGSSELPKPPSTSPVWQGVLAWTGFDAATLGRKEVQSQVLASVQNGGDRSVLGPPSSYITGYGG